MRICLLILLLLVQHSPVIAEECHHFFSLGPEIYSLKREREGGTRQQGTLYGVRGRYDYLASFCPYLGFESAYAKGTLKGNSGGGGKLRSHFTDALIEGRLGYTLQSCSGCCGWLTPFLGGGYVWENNDCIKPSPKRLHFRNRYGYLALGCLAGSEIAPGLELGLRATARFSLQGKVHVSHDPDGESTILKYEQKVHCRVAIPLTYICGRYNVSFEPFYEYRHYGRRNAFPFDFLDTRIRVYGADLFLVIAF